MKDSLLQPEADGGVRVQRVVRPRLTGSNWVNSCDTCRHQEGRHYCLLHSITLKNMDTIRCDEHQDRGRGKRPNVELSDSRPL